MAERPIPLTVIGGYLGAGKTALVNNLLADTRGQKTTVLVNDFGELEVDARLIRERGADTISLANGCICCAVGDQLVSTLMRIGRRGDPPDDLVIETSGIADPMRVAQIGTAGKRFRLSGIVVVVDALEIQRRADDPHVGNLVRQQIGSADLLVINKRDLVDAAELAGVERWIKAIAPSVSALATEQGKVARDILPTATRAGALRRPSMPNEIRPHGMATRTLALRDELDAEAMAQAVRELPDGVLRAKGLLRAPERPGETLRIDRVGRRVTVTAASVPPDDATPNALVVIGVPEAIQSLSSPLGRSGHASA